MENLSKFAIYLGIGIGVTFFILFLIVALPSIFENSIQQWERLDKSNKSDEELRKKFQEHPAYKAMYERFPDAKEEIIHHGRGNGNMKVGVMNFENGNQLVMDMYYNDYDDRVEAHVNCRSNVGERNMGADGLFAEDYIKNTNCLEMEEDHTSSQGTIVTIPHSNGVITLN